MLTGRRVKSSLCMARCNGFIAQCSINDGSRCCCTESFDRKYGRTRFKFLQNLQSLIVQLGKWSLRNEKAESQMCTREAVWVLSLRVKCRPVRGDRASHVTELCKTLRLLLER